MTPPVKSIPNCDNTAYKCISADKNKIYFEHLENGFAFAIRA